MTKFTTKAMKDLLWRQLEDLRNGTGSIDRAIASAKLSDSICKIKYLEINAARAMGIDLTNKTDSDIVIESSKGDVIEN